MPSLAAMMRHCAETATLSSQSLRSSYCSRFPTSRTFWELVRRSQPLPSVIFGTRFTTHFLGKRLSQRKNWKLRRSTVSVASDPALRRAEIVVLRGTPRGERRCLRGLRFENGGACGLQVAAQRWMSDWNASLLCSIWMKVSYILCRYGLRLGVGWCLVA